VTLAGRLKEFSSDYRYFPEPDLVPFEPKAEWVESIRSSLPELPAARRARFARDYRLSDNDIEILTATSATARWFERAAAAYRGDAKKVVNWIIADLYGLLNEAGVELSDARIQPEQLARLVDLVDEGTISGKQAKLVLAGMFETGDDPAAVVDRLGLKQVSDEGALAAAVDEVIAENEDAAAKVRAGQLNTIGFLVGQVMKKTKGQANPGMVNELIRSRLAP
jgi:aspartyl-tRNA(Asn)/glutamyl-tRNA(Gln) amidotransferase subunit B